MIHNTLTTLLINVFKTHGNNTCFHLNTNKYTYDDLNKLSLYYCRLLKENNIQKRDTIVIFSNKTFSSFALMIACLRSGVVYCNLDGNNPKQRNLLIFEKLSPKLIFTDCSVTLGITKEAQYNIETFLINENDLKKEQFLTTSELDNTITGDNPAYIMFTSGSTGVPKGVVISHSNLLSFISWSLKTTQVSSDDKIAQISPLYFDNSVFDFYTTFFSGATLVPVQKPLLNKPYDLVSFIDEHKCTIWFSVPSLYVYLLKMKSLSVGTLMSIRLFIFGGEGFPRNDLKKLYSLYSNQATLLNVYGPTQGTCICSSHVVTKEFFQSSLPLAPLGSINDNFSYEILNNNEEVTEDNVTGELVIKGPNIALGYINDSRTSSSFINSYKRGYLERCYHTGDLVFLDNGLLHFVGRTDNQIKHMGYRIELEEIEAAIKSITEIVEVAVIYIRHNESYGKIHAAYTSNCNDAQIIIEEKISNLIPSYMFPDKYHHYESHLPKNPNGKIDKVKIKNELT